MNGLTPRIIWSDQTNVLVHDVIGQGTRPLLLLHGFLGTGRNLSSLARRLVLDDDLLQTVLVDHLGHGRSPPLPEGADLSTMGAAVVELIDALGTRTKEAVPIVGHSLGGRVALAAKRLAPAKVGRIVLLDITPGSTAHLPSGGIARALLALPDESARREDFVEPLLAAGLTRALTSWLLMNLDRTDAGTYRWRIDRRALFELHQRSGATDLWDVVESGADVAVIRGATSPYVSDEDVARFLRLGIEVATIEGAGHFLHVERPDATYAALVAALGR